jgi:hypothetical protein
MASAILSVCYPEDFTVYDYRVRERLVGFANLCNSTDFEKVWKGFEEYKAKVEESAPAKLNLRDKDRYLYVNQWLYS